MDLYCKLPKAKRVRYRNPLTDRVEYDKTYILKPDEPTKVPDDIAKQLLKQDPHVVSTKPYAEAAEPEKEPEKTAKDYMPVLQELSKKNFEDLKAGEIIEYGKALGIKIPRNAKNEVKLAMLTERCNQLVKELEND